MHVSVNSALSLEGRQGMVWRVGEPLFLLLVAERVEESVNLVCDVGLTFILLFERILLFLRVVALRRAFFLWVLRS